MKGERYISPCLKKLPTLVREWVTSNNYFLVRRSISLMTMSITCIAKVATSNLPSMLLRLEILACFGILPYISFQGRTALHRGD